MAYRTLLYDGMSRWFDRGDKTGTVRFKPELFFVFFKHKYIQIVSASTVS